MRTAKFFLVAFMAQIIDNCPVLIMQRERDTRCSEALEKSWAGRDACEGSLMQMALQRVKVVRVHRTTTEMLKVLW